MIFRGPVRVIAGEVFGNCWPSWRLPGRCCGYGRPPRNRPHPVPKRSPGSDYASQNDGDAGHLGWNDSRRLRHVETTAKQLSAYGKAIQWYLSATAYEENGEKFQQSVDDLITAAGKGDVNSAKEAVLVGEKLYRLPYCGESTRTIIGSNIRKCPTSDIEINVRDSSGPADAHGPPQPRLVDQRWSELCSVH